VGDLSLAAVEEVRGWQGGPTVTGSAVGRGRAGRGMVELGERLEKAEARRNRRRATRRG
jgi:hypothetical protein